MKKLLTLLFLLLTSWFTYAADIVVQTEDMTKTGYTGNLNSPFTGIILFANGDNGAKSVDISNAPGVFKVEVRGASSNASDASVELQIDGQMATSFTFSGTTPMVVSGEINIEGNPGTREIKLILQTDNGSNDTYLDWINLTRIGDIPPPPPPPVIPATGAFESGNYRNMFVEAGYSKAEVDLKVNGIFNQLFYGDNDTERVYYLKGADEAYILDIDNNDVRSEGQSYGMMIAVQMGKKEEFNRLWKFAKTHMQHKDIEGRKGYFRWIVDENGNQLDANTASDGEIYFVTALYFASVRFGNGTGIYNYRAEADYILEQIMNKGWPHNSIIGSVPNMFNPEKKVCFVPYASASEYTDPSYFLPSFLEVWGMMANTNNQYWKDAADVARDYLQIAAHPTTGLMPDYANYDGTPTGGHKEDFVVDAWRCDMNVAMDYAWFKKDERQKDLSKRIQNFFHSQGMYDYYSSYKLDGTPIAGTNYQAVGLVACNATASLASDSEIAWEFIHALWDRLPTTGRYRYYDGLLQMMSMLHLAGEFKCWVNDIPNVNVTGVSLSPASITINAGETATLNTTVIPSNATNQNVSYISSNSDIATINTIGVVTGVREGTASVTVTTQDGSFTATSQVTVNATNTVQSAYPNGVPHAIPGIIEAVNFDIGGEDIAYHDSNPENNGNGPRSDLGVDTEYRTTAGNIGWIARDEWLEYTVDVSKSANYKFTLQVASTGSNGALHIEFNGVDKTGVQSIPSTGSWGVFTNSEINNIALSAGQQVMRVYMDGSDFNLGTITITEETGTPDIPATGISVTPTDKTLITGNSTTLTASVTPSNATNQSVIWSTNNSSVASVNNSGVVTAISAGSAVISAKTADGGFEATCNIIVDNNNNGGDCTFNAPLATPLQTRNAGYSNLHVIGNGPNLGNVTNVSFNWSLENNGLWEFSMRTNDGNPDWYVNLNTSLTHNFGSSNPAVTISGSGFTGLDGDYWITTDENNLVLVEKTNAYAIYFSNSATPPCSSLKSAINDLSESRYINSISLYPNPASETITLTDLGSETFNVYMYNIQGNLLLQKEINEADDSVTFSVQELSQGIYLVKVQSTTKSKSLRFIKH